MYPKKISYDAEKERSTSKNILAQIDATRSLAKSSSSYVENSIENIWMTIVESHPRIQQI